MMKLSAWNQEITRYRSLWKMINASIAFGYNERWNNSQLELEISQKLRNKGAL